MGAVVPWGVGGLIALAVILILTWWRSSTNRRLGKANERVKDLEEQLSLAWEALEARRMADPSLDDLGRMFDTPEDVTL